MKRDWAQLFVEYDQNNPDIYLAFKDYAYSALKRGRSRIGAKAIFEALRWNSTLSAKGDKFKINNNYVSFYVQKLIREDPRFDKMFVQKKKRLNETQEKL